jgi:hypothetical protein
VGQSGGKEHGDLVGAQVGLCFLEGKQGHLDGFLVGVIELRERVRRLGGLFWKEAS